MRKLLQVLLITAAFAGCDNNKTNKEDTKDPKESAKMSMVVTDSSWGFITPSTDIEGLKKICGASNVVDMRVCDLECQDSINVTILYENSKNEVTVYWKDSGYHKVIDRIEAYRDSSDWHTSGGIRIGSGLADLVKLNGKKIEFYGFGWDYGGTITSYTGGALERSKIFYILSTSALSAYDSPAVMGDVGLDSDMPEVKKFIDSIHIRSISLTMNRSEH